MIKRLFKTFGLTLLLLLLMATGAHASGKMEVLLGDTVRLQVEELGLSSDYEWVVTNAKGEIIFNQSSDTFNYTFLEGGEFKVSVKETNQFGEEKITTIMVLVGDLYNIDRLSGSEGETEDFSDLPLRVIYSTLPPLSIENTIPLIGEGTVMFDMDVSRPDVIEYRIDRNIFEDSDGNGVANDDIDNAADDSYLRGGVWETTYTPGEATKIVPEITVVTTSGEVAKAQAEVNFQNAPSTSDDLEAIIEVLPQPKTGQAEIELYDEVQIVGFYSRASKGEIFEYRIDENIFVDSNRDGNPANDIDNLNDPSFKSGDVWTTTYQKTTDQIIAQLTVVGEGGLASRIQREVIFTDRPEVDLGPAGRPTEVFISADKTVVLRNDPIVFQVEGLAERPGKYTFDWDLDGDGKRDKLVEGDNTLTHLYETAGVYNVTTFIEDDEGNQAELSLEVLVKEADQTTADFDYTIDGATVSFTNLSQAAFGLADSNLRYTWSFGDSDEESYQAQEDQISIENPVYTYPFQGTYLVTLRVVDADQVADEKTIEIVVEQGPEIGDENGQGKEGGERNIGGVILTILKWIGVILLLILVVGIFVLGAMMLVIKLQHPELTFEELVDELKLKLLNMIGAGDLIETKPGGKDNADIAQSLEADLAKSPVKEVLQAEVVSPGGAESDSKPSRDLPKKTPAASPGRSKVVSKENLSQMAGGIDFNAAPGTEGPMPDWLKKAQSKSNTPPSKTEPQVDSAAKKAPTPPTSQPPATATETKAKRTAPEPIKKVDSQEANKATDQKTPGPVPDWLKAGQSGQSFSKPAKPDKEKKSVSPEPPKNKAEKNTSTTASISEKTQQKEEKILPKGDEKAAPIPDWLKDTSPQPSALSDPQKDDPQNGSKNQDDSNNPPKDDNGGIEMDSDKDKKPKPSGVGAMPPWLQQNSTPKKEDEKNPSEKPKVGTDQPKTDLKPKGKKSSEPMTTPPTMPPWLKDNSNQPSAANSQQKKDSKNPPKDGPQKDHENQDDRKNPPEDDDGGVKTNADEDKKPKPSGAGTMPPWLQPKTPTPAPTQSKTNKPDNKPVTATGTGAETKLKPDSSKNTPKDKPKASPPPTMPDWLQPASAEATADKPSSNETKVNKPNSTEPKSSTGGFVTDENKSTEVKVNEPTSAKSTNSMVEAKVDNGPGSKKPAQSEEKSQPPNPLNSPKPPTTPKPPTSTKTTTKPVTATETRTETKPKSDSPKATPEDKTKTSTPPPKMPDWLKDSSPQTSAIKDEQKTQGKKMVKPEEDKIVQNSKKNEINENKPKKRRPRRRKSKSKEGESPLEKSDKKVENVKQSKKAKSTDELMKDFVSKKEDSKTKLETKKSVNKPKKKPTPLPKTAERKQTKKQGKKQLPEWLESPQKEPRKKKVSTTPKKQKKEEDKIGQSKQVIQPEKPEEKLPDPLPPLNQVAKKEYKKSKDTRGHTELSIEDLKKGGEFEL